jgi:hypothetical protein
VVAVVARPLRLTTLLSRVAVVAVVGKQVVAVQVDI